MEEERKTTFTILRKTYPFVILRTVVVVGTILPIYWLIQQFADFFFRLFGLDGKVGGIVYSVFWWNFAWIGCVIGISIFGWVRRTVLFYIKAAHVIAIAKTCTDDIPMGSLTMSSFNEMRKRFISVNLFYIADGLILKGISDISRLILEQDVAPSLKLVENPTSSLDRIKNFGIRLFGRVMKTTFSYCDEIILSYVFVRSRINELYGVSKSSKSRVVKESDRKKKDTVKTLFLYAVEGLCFYVKNCIPLFKAAFTTVIAVTIFGWIVAILVGVVMLAVLGLGWMQSFLIIVIIKIAYAIFTYIFVEPYETISLVSEFYYCMFADDGKEDISPIQQKLASFSKPFRRMVAKASGKDEEKVDDSVASPTGSLLDDNLWEIARDSIGSSLEDSTPKETIKDLDGTEKT